MEIISGVHHILGVIANPYLVVQEGGLVLIDTGLPRSHRKIGRYLNGLGYALTDLRHILITHADGDHVGSLAALKASSQATIYASAIEGEAMAAGRMSRPLKVRGIRRWLFSLLGVFFRFQGIGPDVILAPEQTLPLMGGLLVINTPGHTPGHISFFAPQRKILFAGDSIESTGSWLVPSRGMNTWDEGLALESMRRQAELQPEIVCAGHGPVVRDAATKFRHQHAQEG